MNMRCAATEDPWKNGVTERHGAVLGDIVSAAVQECSLEGEHEMRLACIYAGLVKNRRPDKTGYSPWARVFGSSERLPGSVVDAVIDGEDEDLGTHSAIIKDVVLNRSLKIRSEAMVVLEKMDASDKWRHAVVTRAKPTPGPWMPGSCV